MKKILISQKIDPAGLSLFGEGYEILTPNGFTQQAFDAYAPEADAVILRTNLKVTGDFIRSAPRLRVISRTGAGVDNIDLEAAAAGGVTVCNLPALNSIAVSEHTVALMLAAAKRLFMLDGAVRGGSWAEARNSKASVELFSKTLGIVGMGAIGSRVAQICSRGFSMHILCYDPFVEPARYPDYEIISDLNELARRSDFVSIHVPGMESTDKMISHEFFAAMKKGSIFVNCARGSVVDEEALVKALASGKPAMAALDAFIQEPLPASDFLAAMDNVILTPHAAALTAETSLRAAVEACTQALNVLEGRTPEFVYKRH